MENAVLTDFHAHILPGADHGSKNIETSVKQLKLLSAAGVGRVVATPHFYPNADSIKSFLSRRADAAELLCSTDTSGFPRVYLGAEVLVCPGIERMDDLPRLCICGTNVILLEMPFSHWSESYYETVYNVSHSGLTVVMAHIDRYPEEKAIRLIEECGVYVQLNAECFAKFRGRRLMSRWLGRGCVAAYGSDIHGADKTAACRLGQMFEKTGDAGTAVMQKTDMLLSDAASLI